MTDRNYQVIARKWRPQRFAEVVGQEPVVRTLTNALAQGRIAHAYCFSGIRGVGKTTVARLLAKGLNCRAVDGPTAEPCGECESCLEVMDGRSMDVIERDAASDRGIHEMKELIEIARYSPSRDRYKVFILDEAHMLTPEASNALLKVLEEPPSWIVFVLATTEPNKILPTILSRCQHYQFGRISQRLISEHLAKIADAEGVDLSADGLALLATAADGSLRDGQSLLDKLIAFAGDHIDEQTVIDLLGLVDRVLLFRATELIADGDVAGTIAFVDEMVDSGVDLHQFTVDLLGHLRNLLVVATVEDAGSILHLPEGDVRRLREQAESFSVEDLDRAFSLVAGSEYRIKMAEQPRYHLELVLARLARMPTLEPIEDLLAAFRGGEGGHGGGPSGGSGDGRRRRGGRPSSASGRRSAAGRRRSAAAAEQTPPSGGAETTPQPAGKPDQPEVPHPPDEDEPVTPGKPQEPVKEPDQPEIPRPPEVPEAPQPPDEPEPQPPPEPPSEPTPEPPETPELPGTPPPQPPHLETSSDLPRPALLRRIQEQVSVTHPLIAQILGRSSGISLAGEKLVFEFPETAGIFVDRLRDPEMLRRLTEAACAVTGREVIARVETHAARGAGPGPSTPAAGADDGASPSARQQASAAVSSSADAQAGSSNGARPAQPAGGGDPALRQQAEQEPKVQEFVKALRGQIVSVEKL